MTRNRRRFGPLSHITALAALATLASIPFWPMAIERWQARVFFSRLHDASSAAREQAADGLVRLGPVATPWAVRAMVDPDVRVRLLACSILPRTDPDHPAPAIEALAAALKDVDASVRKIAAYQLHRASGAVAARAGAGARGRAVDALRVALGDQDKDVRIAVAYALGAFGASAESAVVDLERALSGSDPALRVHAARALLRIDPSGSRARVLPALRALLADPSAMYERYEVVRILKDETGQDAAAAALIPLLGHAEMGIRHEAISHLIDQCPGAQATRPALVAALGDDDGGLRCEAAFFLLEHDAEMAPRALDTLVGQLVNPRDGSYLPWDMIKKLRERSPDSVGRVVSCLIETLSRAEPPDQRLDAILTLSVIGPPEAMPAVPALGETASSGDRAVALRATEALAKIDPRSASAHIPSLIDWIRPGEDIAVRLTAMATLAELGPVAKAAVPSLLVAADEEELRASSAALAALSRIDPAKAAELNRSFRDGH